MARAEGKGNFRDRKRKRRLETSAQTAFSRINELKPKFEKLAQRDEKSAHAFTMIEPLFEQAQAAFNRGDHGTVIEIREKLGIIARSAGIE